MRGRLSVAQLSVHLVPLCMFPLTKLNKASFIVFTNRVHVIVSFGQRLGFPPVVLRLRRAASKQAETLTLQRELKEEQSTSAHSGLA